MVSSVAQKICPWAITVHSSRVRQWDILAIMVLFNDLPCNFEFIEYRD